MYEKKEEFVAQLHYAQDHEPVPLSEEHSRILTWNAATERCVAAATVTRRDARRRIRLGQPETDARTLELLRGGTMFKTFHRYALASMGVVESISSDARDGESKTDFNESRFRSVPAECE